MPKETSPADAGFAALGLDERILSALTALGYEEPTPIQQQTIPPLIEGRDLLGQAATGTGKTAAFALPILQRFAAHGQAEGPFAIVLVPTRELAMQVAEAVHRYGKALGVRVLPVYGGTPIGRQLHAMRAGVDVVIATPGRALDHMSAFALLIAPASLSRHLHSLRERSSTTPNDPCITLAKRNNTPRSNNSLGCLEGVWC